MLVTLLPYAFCWVHLFIRNAHLYALPKASAFQSFCQLFPESADAEVRQVRAPFAAVRTRLIKHKPFANSALISVAQFSFSWLARSHHTTMANSSPSAEILLHIANHVFLPPKLPQEAAEADLERRINHHLICLVADAVDEYQDFDSRNHEQWARIARMLSRVAQSAGGSLSNEQLQQDMAEMTVGGT
jgi:hypothetical protein